MTSSGRSVHVIPAHLGPDAVLIGAGELALTSILNDPTAMSLLPTPGATTAQAVGHPARITATVRTRGA